MAALGALMAGLLVGLIGDRPALIGVIIAFAAAALTAALSPMREAPNQDSSKAERSSPSPKDAERGTDPLGGASA
jgi:predicted lipid-binding transport protein (Tim44 family)